MTLPSDDAVGTDPGAGLDHDRLVDKAWPFYRSSLFDARVGRDPCAAGRSGKRRRQASAVHDVTVHLHVLLRRTDVDPVAAVHIRDERFFPLDKGWKETALDRPGLAPRDAVEGVGLEYVD